MDGSHGGRPAEAADREDPKKTCKRETRSGGLRCGHRKRSTRGLPHTLSRSSLLMALLLAVLGVEAMQISVEGPQNEKEGTGKEAHKPAGERGTPVAGSGTQEDGLSGGGPLQGSRPCTHPGVHNSTPLALGLRPPLRALRAFRRSSRRVSRSSL